MCRERLAGHTDRLRLPPRGRSSPCWYARYRLADGRQLQKRIGPAWTDRGRPQTGYFTKCTAEAWLRDVLDEARRVTPASMVRTDVTFADAAAEWLRFIEEDRERKPSTLLDYRSALNAHLLPAFGDQPIESITTEEIERWRRSLVGLSNRSKNKLLIQLHGIFRRAQMVWALPVNPLARVEKHPMRPSGDIQVFSPEEVVALVRAAASELDGAIYLTAAFTGLRMGELLALRWRDVDFAGSTIRVRASWAGRALTTPKSGKVRAVPMAPDVASALAQLGRRENWIGEDDRVFASEDGTYLDGSALRRRYKAALDRAALRSLRFHDLRHTFGTRMIAKADIRRVQEWMGHADIQTTMRYLHYAPHEEDARLVAEAFAIDSAPDLIGERLGRRVDVGSRRAAGTATGTTGQTTAIGCAVASGPGAQPEPEAEREQCPVGRAPLRGSRIVGKVAGRVKQRSRLDGVKQERDPVRGDPPSASS